MKPSSTEQTTTITSSGISAMPTTEIVSRSASGAIRTRPRMPQRITLKVFSWIASETIRTGFGSRAAISSARTRMTRKIESEMTAKIQDQPSHSLLSAVVRVS